MARIAGVDLPRHKHIAYALPYLYGIGKATAREICAKSGIAPTKMTEELTEGEIKRIRELLESDYKVEGDLRREAQMNIKRLIPRPASPPWPPGQRAADAHQRSHEEGPPQGHSLPWRRRCSSRAEGMT